MAKARLRDLVVLLPGVTGSVLQKDGTEIWGTSGRFFWGMVTRQEDAVRQLALGRDDPELDDLEDGIVAPRLIADATLVPGLLKIDGYSAIAQMIREGFRVEEGSIHVSKPANFIQFPYDWRRDNRVAARRLETLINSRLAKWREFSGASDAKVILLAHSMGGLVARYYLEVLEGWRDCRVLITLGTPYRGSLNALNFLANGYKQLTVDMTEPMRTFSSIYQLLPTYAVLRTGAIFRRVAGKCSWDECPVCSKRYAGPSPEAEAIAIPPIEIARAQDALRFHHEIMNAVEQHRNDSAYLEQSYRLVPVLGTRQPTNQSADFQSGRVVVGADLPDGIDALLGDGDGTVPRLSAIPIELSDEYRQSFFAERHAALQRNDAILAHIRGVIEQSQVVGLREIRGGDVLTPATLPGLSVSIDDLYAADEPVVIRAKLINAPGATGTLLALITSVRGDFMREQVFHPDTDGWVAEIGGIPPGAYRVRVSAPAAEGAMPIPVHDLFEVAS